MTITAMEKHLTEHYTCTGRLLGKQNRFHVPSMNLREALLQIPFQEKRGWPKLSPQPQSPHRSFVTPGWQHSKLSGRLAQLRCCLPTQDYVQLCRILKVLQVTGAFLLFHRSIKKCWEIIWVWNMASLGSNITVKKAIQSKCRLSPVNTAQTAHTLIWYLKICLKNRPYFNSLVTELGVLYRTRLGNPDSLNRKQDHSATHLLAPVLIVWSPVQAYLFTCLQ